MVDPPPAAKKIRELANDLNEFLVYELNAGQMLQDVKLALSGAGDVRGVPPTARDPHVAVLAAAPVDGAVRAVAHLALLGQLLAAGHCWPARLVFART